jgi:hypothetical protein
MMRYSYLAGFLLYPKGALRLPALHCVAFTGFLGGLAVRKLHIQGRDFLFYDYR